MKETTVRVGGLGSERGQGMSGKVALAGVLALGSGAVHTMAQQKQASVPDAQVESSVLQALAKNPTLAKEQISSTTVYGVVTLSGHVADEPTRALAEDVVARTAGVAKVVDELTLGSGAADGAVADGQGEAGASQAQVSNSQITQPETGQVLQSDGTYAPADSVAQASGPGPTDAGQQGVPTGQQQAPIERGEPDATTLPAQPAYGPGQPTQGGAVQQGQYGQPGQYGQQQGQSGQGQYAQQGQYGQPPYGPQGPYPPTGQYGPPQRYPGGPSAYGQPGTELGGQQAGARVTVPAGTVVWLRVNQPIDSRRSPIGSSFSGVLQQDVVVGGLVAIPRGASLQGTVVDASSAGALKGRAELGLQLSTLTMGGMSYPISSNLWSQASGDKAVRTVNSALGLGALGAIIGGVAGGGAGAAIGAGAGGAAGLGVSAASSGGAVVVPPESVLTFRLAAPVEVSTVSQAELNRLAYNVPGTAYGPPRMVRRYPAYYPYGPGYYYPRYYRGYPY